MAIIVGGFFVDSGDNKSNAIVQQESKNTTRIWLEYGKNPSKYCQTFRMGRHKYEIPVTNLVHFRVIVLLKYCYTFSYRMSQQAWDARPKTLFTSRNARDVTKNT